MASQPLPQGGGGRVLIVTGASRGIGAATARLAGHLGYLVCVNYVHREEQARLVVDEVNGAGGRAIAVQADIGEEADVRRLFTTVERELGPIYALVNNAGITGGPATIGTVTSEQINRAFRVT